MTLPSCVPFLMGLCASLWVCLMVDGELLEDSNCGVAFIGSNTGASFF